MSFSYDETQIDPNGVYYIDVVRFLVNDTVEATADLSDELITALYNITSATSSQILRNYQTAVAAQEYINNKRANNIQSFSSGGTSITYNQSNLNARLSYLRQMVMVYGGGIGGVLYPTRRSGFSTGW